MLFLYYITSGYGTPVINTTAGKIIGGMCAIAGVPLFAIPIPILSKHLERVYQRELRKNEWLKERMGAMERARYVIIFYYRLFIYLLFLLSPFYLVETAIKL